MPALVVGWLKKPYDADMDIWHWILFIGLILIISAAWKHTLGFIE